MPELPPHPERSGVRSEQEQPPSGAGSEQPPIGAPEPPSQGAQPPVGERAAASAGQPAGSGDGARTQPLRIIVLGGLVVAVALIAYLLLSGGDGDEVVEPGQPQVVSADELREFADGVDHEVYWVGERPNTSLELTETEDGDIYVRYLPEGVEAEDPRGEFLTIGSYPVSDGIASVNNIGAQLGGVRQTLEGGRVMATKAAGPTSVYFADPDSQLQVEVYDKDPKVPVSLVLSGAVIPVS